MNFILFIQVLFYGILEGITEWLPISSTGHLILFESFWPMDFSADFLTVFRVVIQLGAALAVLVKFIKRLNPFRKGISDKKKAGIYRNWINIIVACIPAGIAGLLLDDFLDEHLYIWQVVAAMLIVYGLLFFVVENVYSNKTYKYRTMEELPVPVAFAIGVFQILSLIPGTSRSGVTILAALIFGASRVAAADFSFCLALPIMCGASFLKIVKHGLDFSAKELLFLFFGMLVAFVTSMIVIKFLVAFIKKYNYKIFGAYRVLLGVVIIIIAIIFPSLLPNGEGTVKNRYGLPEYVTEDYIKVNPYSRPAVPLLKVNDIVIHYVGNPGSSAESNRSYFNSLQTGQTGTYASSNFIVGLDGEVLAVVPIDEIAYCSNSRNSDTISIEVCHPDATGKFNDKTYASVVKLTAWLLNHYNLDASHVIRHYDVTG
ncbi:MAG: undecaprenyl-diphosphate phosphatase, partial [Lachnospiraceae bacterium]|nr:undecaprenyl-diphosphate phosphatase [Candidatus Minthocola equi]